MPDSQPSRLPILAILFRAAVCLALVGAGIGVVGALVATKPDAGRNASKAPPPRVAVLEVAPVAVEAFVRGYGTARALDSADVPARVGAVVEGLGANYAVGRAVAKGEVLVALDATDFERQVEIGREAIRAIDAQVAVIETQATAARETAALVAREREIAAKDLARVEEAAREGAAQAREVDLARAALLGAGRALVAAEDAVASIPPRLQALAAQKAVEEARLALATSSVERCVIRAPIDGTLQLAELEVGESVAPGQTVARVVDGSRIEVPLRIPASLRALAPIGARAEVVVRADGRRLDGVIARVAPEDDPATRTATVFVEYAQDRGEGALAPGAFVEARISAGLPAPRTLVPRRAIRDDFIRVVEGGRVRERRIGVDFAHSDPVPSAGIADVDWAVLVDDLPAGTLVVLDGSRSLAEGQEIAPVRPGEAAASRAAPGDAKAAPVEELPAAGDAGAAPAKDAPRAGDGA